MMPAIFKTGIFATAIIILYKCISFLLGAKRDTFLLTPVEVAETGPVPLVAMEISKDPANSGRKKRDTATPVVNPSVDFDRMHSQLQSTLTHYDP